MERILLGRRFLCSSFLSLPLFYLLGSCFNSMVGLFKFNRNGGGIYYLPIAVENEFGWNLAANSDRLSFVGSGIRGHLPSPGALRCSIAANALQ